MAVSNGSVVDARLEPPIDFSIAKKVIEVDIALQGAKGAYKLMDPAATDSRIYRESRLFRVFMDTPVSKLGYAVIDFALESAWRSHITGENHCFENKSSESYGIIK